MTRLRLILPIALTAFLWSCDTFPSHPGYVNRLNHAVTIVEHTPKRASSSIHLAAGEIHQPIVALPPDSIDILDARGHSIGHYRVQDIPREDPRGDDYIAIIPHGVKFQFSYGPSRAQ